MTRSVCFGKSPSEWLVGALENIYKDRVAAMFDDKVKQCDAQIASYTQNLTRMFHKCETRLKNLQKRRSCGESG